MTTDGTVLKIYQTVEYILLQRGRNINIFLKNTNKHKSTHWEGGGHLFAINICN